MLPSLVAATAWYPANASVSVSHCLAILTMPGMAIARPIASDPNATTRPTRATCFPPEPQSFARFSPSYRKLSLGRSIGGREKPRAR
jgi:hypothetical protein